MLPGSVDRAGPWLPRSRSRATPLRFRSFGQPRVPRGQPQSRSRVGNPPRSQPLNPALDSRPAQGSVQTGRARPVPDRAGSHGEHRGPTARPPGADTAPLQVGPEAGLRYPQLPRLRARVSSSRIGRSGSPQMPLTAGRMLGSAAHCPTACTYYASLCDMTSASRCSLTSNARACELSRPSTLNEELLNANSMQNRPRPAGPHNARTRRRGPRA